MSKLEMLSCDGCGASAEGRTDVLGVVRAPDGWLEIEGPATPDEITGHRVRASKRHACSPACLVVLAERLAALKNAIQPAGAAS